MRERPNIVSFPRYRIRFLTLETVQDLAVRFADGRLSTDKLLQANDEELAEMLIQVRGVGRVSLFDPNRSMFSLTWSSGLVHAVALFSWVNTYQVYRS